MSFISEDRDKDIPQKYSYIIDEVEVSATVYERACLAKFGDCAGNPPGPEPNITVLDQGEIEIRAQPPQDAETEESELERIIKNKMATTTLCTHCHSTTHFYLSCPQRKEAVKGPKDYHSNHDDHEIEFTVRLTNINQASAEYAVHQLVYKAAEKAGANRPSRCVLVKDKITRESCGFAFITFSDSSSAQRFIEVIDGHGYDSMVLRAEIAPPKKVV